MCSIPWFIFLALAECTGSKCNIMGQAVELKLHGTTTNPKCEALCWLLVIVYLRAVNFTEMADVLR